MGDIKSLGVKIHYGCDDLQEVEGHRGYFRSPDGRVEVSLKVDKGGHVSEITLTQDGKAAQLPYSPQEGQILREIYIPVPFKPPALFNKSASEAYKECRKPEDLAKPDVAAPATPTPTSPKVAHAAVPAPAERAAAPTKRSTSPAAPSAAVKSEGMDHNRTLGYIEQLSSSDYPDIDKQQKVISDIMSVLKKLYPKQKSYTEKQVGLAYDSYKYQHPPKVARPVAAPSAPVAAPAAPSAAVKSEGMDHNRTLGYIEQLSSSDYPDIDKQQKVISDIMSVLKKLYPKQKSYTEKQVGLAYDSYKYQHPPQVARPAVAGPAPIARESEVAAVAPKATELSDVDRAQLITIKVHMDDLKWAIEFGPKLFSGKLNRYDNHKRLGDILTTIGLSEDGQRYDSAINDIIKRVPKNNDVKKLKKEFDRLVKQCRGLQSGYAKNVRLSLISYIDQLKDSITYYSKSNNKGDFDGYHNISKELLSSSDQYLALLQPFINSKTYDNYQKQIGLLRNQVEMAVYAAPSKVQPLEAESPSIALDLPKGHERIDVICPNEVKHVTEDLKFIAAFIQKADKLEKKANASEFSEVMERLRRIQSDMKTLKRCAPNSKKVKAFEHEFKRLTPLTYPIQEKVVQIAQDFATVYSSIILPPVYQEDVKWLESSELSGKYGTNRTSAESVINYLESIFGNSRRGVDSWSLDAVSDNIKPEWGKLKNTYLRAKMILKLIAEHDSGVKLTLPSKPYVESDQEKISRLERKFYKECSEFEGFMKLLEMAPGPKVSSSIEVLNQKRERLLSALTDLKSRFDGLESQHQEIARIEKLDGSSASRALHERENRLAEIRSQLSVSEIKINNRISDIQIEIEKLKARKTSQGTAVLPATAVPAPSAESEISKEWRPKLDAIQRDLDQQREEFRKAVAKSNLDIRVAACSQIIAALGQIVDSATVLINDDQLQTRADNIKNAAKILRLEVENERTKAQSGPESAILRIKDNPEYAAFRDKISYKDGVIQVKGLPVDRCTALCRQFIDLLKGLMPGHPIHFVAVHVKGTEAQQTDLNQILLDNNIQSVFLMEPDVSKDAPHIDIRVVVDPRKVPSIKTEFQTKGKEIAERLQKAAAAEEAHRLEEISAKQSEYKSLIKGAGGSALIQQTIDGLPVQAFRIPLDKLSQLSTHMQKIRDLLGTQMDRPLLMLTNNATDDDDIDHTAKEWDQKQHVAAYSTGMVSEKYAYVIAHDFTTTKSTGRIYEAWQKDSFRPLVRLITNLDKGSSGNATFPKTIVKGWTLMKKPPITLKSSAIYSGKLNPRQLDQHLKTVDNIGRFAVESGARVLVMYHNAPSSSGNTIVSDMPMSMIRSQLMGQNIPVSARFFRASNITENNGKDIVHYIMLMPGDNEDDAVKRYTAYIASVDPH